jgi:hypothetical protein
LGVSESGVGEITPDSHRLLPSLHASLSAESSP